MATHPQSPKVNAPSSLAMEAAVPMPESAAPTDEPPVAETEVAVREQDRLMPIANVVRIMRRVLPAHAKVADEAKEVIQECVSEFISFVTGEANDRCHGEHRKTVTAEDVVWAMERLGFDDYVAPLKAYLRRLRESEGRGSGGGRGDRAQLSQTRAPNGPAAAPVAAVHVMQARPVAFQNTVAALARGYGVVPRQAPFSAAPRFGAQRVVLGGDRAMAVACYGGSPAAVADGIGGCGDETSSSNDELPAEATTSDPHYPN